MFKLFRCSYTNVPKLMTYAAETSLHQMRCPPNNHLISLMTKPGLEVIQVRYKDAPLPPLPHGIPPAPRGIPYTSPGKQPTGLGPLLLLVPIISFGLGTWQVYRLRWKTNLLQTIKERSTMEPIPLPQDPADVAQMEFQKVIVEGTFDHENEILYGPKCCIVDGEPNTKVIAESGKDSFGFNLVTPLVRSDTGERILVNRGWIRSKTINPAKRPWSKTEGQQTIIGVVRLTEHKPSFGPETNYKYNMWHYRLIPEMAKKTNCLPIYIDATTDHSIPNCLWGGQTITKLRNEHKTYLITWYALSIATFVLWFTRFVKR